MILIVVAVLALIVIFVIAMYNGLVRLKVQCDNAWSDIDVQLKRRYDLIPNLVATVQGIRRARKRARSKAWWQARNQRDERHGPGGEGRSRRHADRARCGKCLRWPKRIRNCAPSRASRAAEFALAN